MLGGRSSDVCMYVCIVAAGEQNDAPLVIVGSFCLVEKNLLPAGVDDKSLRKMLQRCWITWPRVAKQMTFSELLIIDIVGA